MTNTNTTGKPKLLCRIMGHIGWPDSLDQLIPPVWGGKEEFYDDLNNLKCKRCGLTPKDL